MNINKYIIFYFIYKIIIKIKTNSKFFKKINSTISLVQEINSNKNANPWLLISKSSSLILSIIFFMRFSLLKKY